MNHNPQQVAGNIRAIRRRRNLSQAELARLLGMRPGPVNNIEQGRNLPSAKVLCKLAAVLDVPIDNLFADPDAAQTSWLVSDDADAACVREAGVSYGAESTPLPLRDPRAMLIREPDEWRQLPVEVLTALSKVADAILALEDICGAQKWADLPLSLPFGMSDPGLQRLAERVRQLLGIGNAVIFDYLELLENAGLRVTFCHLPERVESLACHDSINANAFIFIANELNAERQLFRVLYELGRIYLRGNWGGGEESNAEAKTWPRDYRGKPLTPDRAARRFAALLLMPEQAVRATIAQLGITSKQWTYELILRIKHRFGVSAESFLYRLDELHSITPSLRTEIQRRIHAHYQATGFTEPDSTRRILTPNGRLGDLLTIARTRGDSAEMDEIEAVLSQAESLISNFPARQTMHNSVNDKTTKGNDSTEYGKQNSRGR